MAQQKIPPEAEPGNVYCFSHFVLNSCNNPDCKFAHSIDSLIIAHDQLWRHTISCALHKIQRCPAQDDSQCNFAHSFSVLNEATAKRKAAKTRYDERDFKAKCEKIHVPSDLVEKTIVTIAGQGKYPYLTEFPGMYTACTGEIFPWKKLGFPNLASYFLQLAEQKLIKIYHEAVQFRIGLSIQGVAIYKNNRKKVGKLLETKKEEELPAVRKWKGESRGVHPCQSIPFQIDIFAEGAERLQPRKYYKPKRHPMVCWCGFLVTPNCVLFPCGCLTCASCFADQVKAKYVECRKCGVTITYEKDPWDVMFAIYYGVEDPMLSDLYALIYMWPINCLMAHCRWQHKPRGEWGEHVKYCQCLKRHYKYSGYRMLPQERPILDMSIDGQPDITKISRLDLPFSPDSNEDKDLVIDIQELIANAKDKLLRHAAKVDSSCQEMCDDMSSNSNTENSSDDSSC